MKDMAKMTKEERAKRLNDAFNVQPCTLAYFIVDEQDRREGPLVAFIRNGVSCICHPPTGYTCDRCETLRAYDALDAKPEPTLLEAVKAADARAHSMRDKPGQMYAAVLLEDWLSIKAAVEREERCAGERKGK